VNEKITYLDPNEIQTDPRLQVRSEVAYGSSSPSEEKSRLTALRKRIERVVTSGEHSDPIEVFTHDDDWLVFDGHNRLEVYQRVAKRSPVKIPVIIRPYTLKEALGRAYLVNTRHGVAVSQKDATRAAFRSCVFSNDGITTADLIKQGLGERLSQKVRQAARTLIDEAKISATDDEQEVIAKVGRWCKRMAREGYAKAGADSIPTDHLGFPSYRFVLDKKPTEDKGDNAKIEAIASSIEALAQSDPYLFLKALKRVSNKARMDLPVRVSKIEQYADSHGDDDEDYEF